MNRDRNVDGSDLSPAYLAAAIRHARALWQEARAHQAYARGAGDRQADLNAWNEAEREVVDALDALRELARKGRR